MAPQPRWRETLGTRLTALPILLPVTFAKTRTSEGAMQVYAARGKNVTKQLWVGPKRFETSLQCWHFNTELPSYGQLSSSDFHIFTDVSLFLSDSVTCLKYMPLSDHFECLLSRSSTSITENLQERLFLAFFPVGSVVIILLRWRHNSVVCFKKISNSISMIPIAHWEQGNKNALVHDQSRSVTLYSPKLLTFFG